jgi:hypothetical protein
MGCGASSHTDGRALHKKNQSSHSGNSRYAPQDKTNTHTGREEQDDEDDLDSYDEPPMTDEQLRLCNEMEMRSSVSTAESADEPSEFAKTVKIKMRVAKARVLHGIDGACESSQEIDATEAQRRQQPSAEAGYRPFGDLKPRQVRKIQEWVNSMYQDNGNTDIYDAVPDRYFGAKGFSDTASGHDIGTSGSSHYDNGDSPRSLCSPPGPAPSTPHRYPSGGGGGFADVSTDGGLPSARDGLRDMDVSDYTPTPRFGAAPGFVDDSDGDTPRMGSPMNRTGRKPAAFV